MERSKRIHFNEIEIVCVVTAERRFVPILNVIYVLTHLFLFNSDVLSHSASCFSKGNGFHSLCMSRQSAKRLSLTNSVFGVTCPPLDPSIICFLTYRPSCNL